MATRDDRSLPSGMSIPRWMKTKMTDRLDFEQSAFSPTELDDSFMFYYRNNNRSGNEPPSNNQTQEHSLIETSNAKLLSADTAGSNRDFSKHTLYCQKFLQNSDDANSAQLVKFPSATKTKPSGIDDGFKGEAARCGSSVIRVAHQMVAGKVIRGFNLETHPTDCDGPPEGFNPSLRRGSRSLPTSPLSSPKTARKLANKYFTGPFVDTENNNLNGNWLLSNLLSKRKTLSQSVGYIAEENLNLTHSTQELSVDDSNLDGNKKKTQVFVAKPSELREMNFWSPTSM